MGIGNGLFLHCGFKNNKIIMTVRDIFELRRQGRIEEAYDAIRPMYAVHKGKYTSLCMFWTAGDIFKKRLDDGLVDEAAKILEAMKRVLPYIREHDRQPADANAAALGSAGDNGSESAAAFIQYASRRLAQARGRDGSTQQSLGTQSAPLPTDTANRETIPSDKVDKTPDVKPVGEQEGSIETSPADTSAGSTAPKEYTSGRLAVGLDEGIIRPIDGINAIQRVVLACIVGHPGYCLAEIATSTGIPEPVVQKHIAVLEDHNLVAFRDSNTASGYFVVS